MTIQTNSYYVKIVGRIISQSPITHFLIFFLNWKNLHHKRLQTSFSKSGTFFLRGFGSFIVKQRAQKTGRDISKNTTIIIPAHNVPAFKPSKEFVNKVKTNVQL